MRREIDRTLIKQLTQQLYRVPEDVHRALRFMSGSSTALWNLDSDPARNVDRVIGWAEDHDRLADLVHEIRDELRSPAFETLARQILSQLEAVHSAAVADAAITAVPRTGASTRPLATPVPVYLSAEIQALSERLRDAQTRKQVLRCASLATDEVDREILQLRRQLREGGQLRAGDSLGDGRYLLIEPVGRGGFAVVWKAHDTMEMRTAAIKALHPRAFDLAMRSTSFAVNARTLLPGRERCDVPSGSRPLRLHAPDRVLRDIEQLGDLAHQPVALLAQRVEAAAERVRVVAVDVSGQPHGAVARQDHELGPASALALAPVPERAVHALGPRLDRLGPREPDLNHFLVIDAWQPIGTHAPYVPRLGEQQ